MDRMMKISFLLVIITCFAFTTGCGKLKTENYEKLKTGMEYGEVIKILGNADECSSAIGIKKCTWGDSKKHIKVNFAGDRVILFSAKGL
jgi:hypothetical protein